MVDPCRLVQIPQTQTHGQYSTTPEPPAEGHTGPGQESSHYRSQVTPSHCDHPSDRQVLVKNDRSNLGRFACDALRTGSIPIVGNEQRDERPPADLEDRNRLITVRAAHVATAPPGWPHLLHDDEVRTPWTSGQQVPGPTLDLWAVNRNAGPGPMCRDFVAVLTASLNAAAATDGIVDPLLGRRSAAGYDAWAGPKIGSQTVRCRAGSRSRSGPICGPGPHPPIALDLGGCQGWLADRPAPLRTPDRVRRDGQHGWRPACA